LERTKLFVRARRTSHDKMLVLALQFSRCGPGASTGAPSTGLELDGERRRPAPPNREAAAQKEVVSDSFKTEEKTSASFRTSG
jgi:hypothetical protein